MQKLLTPLLILFSLSVLAQDTYLTETDIRYYPESQGTKDVYMASQCRLDVYYPKDLKNFATVIWYHGGGITGGSKEIPKALMNKGFAVIGVGYRLSPTVKAPEYILDAAAAVAWTYNNIKRYGGNNKLIFVSGHSAGAYLGMMSILDKKYLARHHIDADHIAAIIPFSGQAITHFTVREERGIIGTQPIIDSLAPLFHVRADAPPILLITGDRELEFLGRYEENAYLNRMLKLAGHTKTKIYELQGFNHNNMPEGAYPLLIKEIAALSKEINARK